MLLTLSPSHRKTPCQHHAFPHIMPPPHSLTVPLPISWVHQSPLSPCPFSVCSQGCSPVPPPLPSRTTTIPAWSLPFSFSFHTWGTTEDQLAGGVFRAPILTIPIRQRGMQNCVRHRFRAFFSACGFIFLAYYWFGDHFPRTI